MSAEATRVCECIVSVVASSSPVDASAKPVVRPMFEAVMNRLSAQDQDQVWRGEVVGIVNGVWGPESGVYENMCGGLWSGSNKDKETV